MTITPVPGIPPGPTERDFDPACPRVQFLAAYVLQRTTLARDLQAMTPEQFHLRALVYERLVRIVTEGLDHPDCPAAAEAPALEDLLS